MNFDNTAARLEFSQGDRKLLRLDHDVICPLDDAVALDLIFRACDRMSANVDRMTQLGMSSSRRHIYEAGLLEKDNQEIDQIREKLEVIFFGES